MRFWMTFTAGESRLGKWNRPGATGAPIGIRRIQLCQRRILPRKRTPRRQRLLPRTEFAINFVNNTHMRTVSRQRSLTKPMEMLSLLVLALGGLAMVDPARAVDEPQRECLLH